MVGLRRLTSILIATLILAACSSPPSTDTVTVQRGSLPVTISGSGSVEPLESAELHFEVPGTVRTIQVREGDHVKQGQVLGTIDPRDLDQQVIQADANQQLEAI